MKLGVVVGNPKPASRTLHAATMLGGLLDEGAASLTIDLAEVGCDLLEWGNPRVAELVGAMAGLDTLIVASPTYKATYTGLLKLFLDQIPSNGLRGVVGVPLMLGAGPGHALAPELLLKPVLVELGATCPAQGCYVTESAFDDEGSYEPWLARWRDVIRAATR